MNKHPTGARKEWLAAELALLNEEKGLTRRSDARNFRGAATIAVTYGAII